MVANYGAHDAQISQPLEEDISKAPGTATPTTTAAPTENVSYSSIVVHHLNDSRSQRLLWLLEELEIPYSIKKYTRTAEMRAPQDLKGVHPLGKAPILTDGDVTIAESGAIIEYLISKYGEKFRPAESGKVDDLYFSHYAEGSVMPIIITQFIFSIIPQRSPFFMRPIIRPLFTAVNKKLVEPELRAHCELIESKLEKSETGWLAGCDHPTSADFMMVFPAEILASKSPLAGPQTKKYVERIHERPAYKRALEKGGEYEYAKI